MAVSVVSAYVVVELDVTVELVPITTCKIRKAPRRLFNDEAGKTVAAVKAVGKFVGVAIFNSLYHLCCLKDCYLGQTRSTAVVVSHLK